MGPMANSLQMEKAFANKQGLPSECAPLPATNTARVIAGARYKSATADKKRPQSVATNLELVARCMRRDRAWRSSSSLKDSIAQCEGDLPQGKTGTTAARHVMIVGNSARGQAIFENICASNDAERDVKEFLLDRHMLGPEGPAIMSRIARQGHIDEVIIATSDPAILQVTLREAKRNQLDAYIAPDLGGADVLSFDLINGMPLLKVCEQRLPERALAGKRILDALLAVLGLVLLMPLLAAIALMIGFESPGPVLYRAARVGRKGRRFACYKFRTMVPQADALKRELRFKNQRTGAFFKIADDPRVTRVGRFLRRYSLDELPQLWNVLRGDMSLVGPRPHPPDDVEGYDIGDLRRLDFTPGITGLWQVSARQDPSFQRCVDLDVEYIESWSLSLDFRILWRTIAVVLQGTGA